MSDEQAIEAIARPCTCEPAWKDRGMVDDKCYHHRFVEALAALRAEGYDLYRPDECARGDVVYARWDYSPNGRYYLVPAGNLVIEDEHGTQTKVVPVGGED